MIGCMSTFLGCTNEKKMSKDFCACLINDNWQCIKAEVNGFLSNLDLKDHEEDNYIKIKKWLQSKACIQNVVIEEPEMTSLPPLKAFFIVTEKGRYMLLIAMDEKRWRYDRLVKMN